MGSVSASNEKVVCRKVCFKRLTKFQVKKKSLIGLQDSSRIGWFFLTCICMMNFMCRMCSLCVVVHVKTVKIKLSGVLIQTKAIL